MVNPISAGPVALPTDLVNIELPSAMTRPAAQVQEAQSAFNSGSATTGGYGNKGQSETSLERTLEQINDSMRAWSTGMQFSIDDDAQRLVVSIIDSQSGEVLRTVPTEAVLRIAKMIVQLQGSTVDTRA